MAYLTLWIVIIVFVSYADYQPSPDIDMDIKEEAELILNENSKLRGDIINTFYELRDNEIQILMETDLDECIQLLQSTGFNELIYIKMIESYPIYNENEELMLNMINSIGKQFCMEEMQDWSHINDNFHALSEHLQNEVQDKILQKGIDIEAWKTATYQECIQAMYPYINELDKTMKILYPSLKDIQGLSNMIAVIIEQYLFDTLVFASHFFRPTMSFNFEHIKTMNQTSKCIVFGYIHESQAISPSNNPYFNIPPLVSYWCLLYYYQREYFQTHSKEITLNESKDIATVIENPLFGNKMIFGITTLDMYSKYMYIWQFKIIHVATHWGRTIQIGICKNDDDHLYCAYESDGLKKCDAMLFSQSYGRRFEPNDTIRMEVNTKHYTIEFYKNDVSQGIAQKDIKFTAKTKYRMAILMPELGNSVQIMDYKSISTND